ncbi:phospholipase C [Acidithiobacillus sp.]
MMQHWSRRQFLQALGAGSAAGLASHPLSALAAAENSDQIAGLRQHIRHIVVIYQENRSFDHYFGAYRHPRGAAVANLLGPDGQISAAFDGLQKNPAGIPYSTLPMPEELPVLQHRLLPNRPFALGPYVAADQNIPWDPAHLFFRMQREANGGKMDRFVGMALSKGHFSLDHAPISDVDSMQAAYAVSRPSGAVLGYYTRQDLPFYHALADHYVLFDHFHQAMFGGSTGNALFLAAARTCQDPKAPREWRVPKDMSYVDLPYDQAGYLINNLPPLQGPTDAIPEKLAIAPDPAAQDFPNIGDRLDAAGVPWAWYQEGWDRVKPWAMKDAFGPGDGSAIVDTGELYVPHHNPFQYFARWKTYVQGGHLRDITDFFGDLQAGQLPAVSFLKAAASHNEHPADSAPRWGMDYVQGILNSLAKSPAWPHTLVLITYDEGGGFWDHVPLPARDYFGPGTRIPALLVSAWARSGYVDHRIADTTSILRLIETRFRLPPLNERDAAAYALTDGLDFSGKVRDPAFI